MNSGAFKIRPVARYDGPRYPTTVTEAPEESGEQKRDLLLQIAACCFALALMVGVAACGIDENSLLCDRPECQDPITGDGNDDDGEIKIRHHNESKTGCTPGELACVGGGAILATCNENGDYAYTVCESHCDEVYGTTDAYSWGCDAEAADPCQCDYDMMDGGMPMCNPGEIYCYDDTLVTCTEEYWEEYTDCDAHCKELWGPDAQTLGCDASQTDPCQCDYGMMAGVMIECTPGDIVCADETTLALCNDYYYYDYQDCNDYCAATVGDDSTSAGCSTTDPEDPCGCS